MLADGAWIGKERIERNHRTDGGEDREEHEEDEAGGDRQKSVVVHFGIGSQKDVLPALPRNLPGRARRSTVPGFTGVGLVPRRGTGRFLSGGGRVRVYRRGQRAPRCPRGESGDRGEDYQRDRQRVFGSHGWTRSLERLRQETCKTPSRFPAPTLLGKPRALNHRGRSRITSAEASLETRRFAPVGTAFRIEGERDRALDQQPCSQRRLAVQAGASASSPLSSAIRINIPR